MSIYSRAISILYLYFLTIHIAWLELKDYNCNDENLNICSCKFDDNDIMHVLTMECSSYLHNRLNILPNLIINKLSVKNSFTSWPIIPSIYTNTTFYLDLSFNKIDSIGDLNYLDHIQFLNLSNNLITKINPRICSLKEMYIIDLRNNFLETLSIEDFICDTEQGSLEESDGIFSVLEYIFLANNRIKYINNLDLVFVGMPILSVFDVSNNQLVEINIDQISQNSKNVLNKLSQAIQKFDNLESFMTPINQKTRYYYSFKNNSIQRVNFNFKMIYSAIMSILPISKNLFLRFISINLKSNNITCDCNLYDDISFILDEDSSLLDLNINILKTYISILECKSKGNVKQIMVSLYNKYENESMFCDKKIVKNDSNYFSSSNSIKASNNMKLFFIMTFFLIYFY